MDCEALRTAQCPEKVTCSVRCCVLQKFTACSWDLLAWGSSGSVVQYLGRVGRERFYSARSTELVKCYQHWRCLYYFLSFVFHAATSEHHGTYVKFGAVCGRVIFFQPPSGQEGYGESYFSRCFFFFEGGGGWRYAYIPETWICLNLIRLSLYLFLL